MKFLTPDTPAGAIITPSGHLSSPGVLVFDNIADCDIFVPNGVHAIWLGGSDYNLLDKQTNPVGPVDSQWFDYKVLFQGRIFYAARPFPPHQVLAYKHITHLQACWRLVQKDDDKRE